MKKGFTLIELIIVMAVLGVLISSVLVVIDPGAQRKKANDSRRKSDLAQIQRALEIFYQDNGKYPDHVTTSPNKNKIDSNPGPGVIIVNWGDPFTPYMQVLPKDPTTYNYAYVQRDFGQSYSIYAYMERGKNDSQICKYSVATCTTGDEAICRCGNAPDPADNNCNKICNFGVSSPNVSP